MHVKLGCSKSAATLQLESHLKGPFWHFSFFVHRYFQQTACWTVHTCLGNLSWTSNFDVHPSCVTIRSSYENSTHAHGCSLRVYDWHFDAEHDFVTARRRNNMLTGTDAASYPTSTPKRKEEPSGPIRLIRIAWRRCDKPLIVLAIHHALWKFWQSIMH